MRPVSAGAPPRWIHILAAAALVYLALPIIGLLIDMPITRAVEVLTSPAALSALGVSLRTVFIATVICVVLGVPAALVMSRMEGRAADVARTLVTVPMVLPPVVAGLALLATFGKRKLLGAQFSALGIDIAFSSIAVVMAQVFVAMPFLITSLEAALRSNRGAHAEIAATLGASPTYILFHVTLPIMRPAIVSGTALSAARCLGEFGATLTFAGSLEGVTRTVPLAIYLQREVDPDVALVLSLVLLILAVLVVSLTARGRKL